MGGHALELKSTLCEQPLNEVHPKVSSHLLYMKEEKRYLKRTLHRSQPFRLSAIKSYTQFRICLRMSGKNCKLTWHHRWPHQFVERLYREQTANMRECSEMSCLNQNMGNCKCLSIYHTNKMPNGNSGKIASTKVGSTWCHWRWLTRWPLQTVMISTWIFLQKNKQYLRGL